MATNNPYSLSYMNKPSKKVIIYEEKNNSEYVVVTKVNRFSKSIKKKDKQWVRLVSKTTVIEFYTNDEVVTIIYDPGADSNYESKAGGLKLKLPV